MTFNQTTSIEYKTTAGTVSASNVTETGGTGTSLDRTVSAGAVNSHSVLAVDVSQVISFVIYSTQAITIKTNSSSLPDQMFTIAAGIGFTWNSTRTDSNPLTTDITDLYFSNPGTADASVNLRFLYA